MVSSSFRVMILSTCRTHNSGYQPRPVVPPVLHPASQGAFTLPARVPGSSHLGSTMPYLGLQDLRVSLREITPNPISGFASPESPTPWGQSVFQGLHQAVCSTARASHQEAGELSLCGILYPLQEQGKSLSGPPRFWSAESWPSTLLPPQTQARSSRYLQHLLITIDEKKEYRDVNSSP